MEVPEIPEIHIPEVYVPDVPLSPVLTIAVPGCTYTHRDLGNTGNHNLLLADKNGVSYSSPCGEIPHFFPMSYEPDKLVLVEEAPINSPQPELPAANSDIPETPKKKEEDTFKPCPGPNDQRVGDYRNEKKLERVIGHKETITGDCETLYEDVQWVEQWLPTPALAVNTAAIGLIAATSPLIISAIKPLVKNLVKKLTSRKKKENEREASPDQGE